MNNFQRMIVIPQEEYLQLSAVQNARQPLTQQYYTLENKYQESQHIKDPYERLLTQSETLDDMKRLKEQMRNNIVISTPKPYQSRAKALYENVSNFIKFNDRGEIFDKENQVISHSRIEDLIQHAVRDRRRNMLPVGWSYFLNMLREHNIPKSVLNRDTLQELEHVHDRPKSPSVDASPKKRRKIIAQRPSKLKREWKPSKRLLESLRDFK